ncbi:MAG: phenylalanine--tRNA ligase subunit beta [Candidatus Eisenbacteria bacterium]
MIVSLNWLRRYVDFDMDARELALRLTNSLTEAEAVEPSWSGVAGVVAAKVVTAEKHPDSDTLSVCVVDYGAGSSTVVCGAPNVRAGMMSVLAPPGSAVAGGRSISEATIRGRRSYGMLVSAMELGLGESSEGILELGDDVKPGGDVRSLLGLDDELIELDVQPNRPDCLGMIGVAREVAALVGGELRYPTVELTEQGTAASEMAAVVLEDPVACPRYIARVIRELTIGPSPAWLQSCLRSVGGRSISNVVDITNFVMLEFGHPIHAFDYDRVSDHKIIVRRAREGETMTTLDGVERKLDGEHLLICDGREPVALAGIMGGADSEVSDNTTNVLLECAWFDPVVVRRGAARLGLRTEASQRFERGVDPCAMEMVAARACALMAELAGGSVAPGVIDAGTDGGERPAVALTVARVTGMLGDDVGRAETADSLARLGFRVESGDGDGQLVVGVPSHRPDVTTEADLIEEVLRARGYDEVLPEVPFHSIDAPEDTGERSRNRVRDAMVGLGFFEILTTSFMSHGAVRALGGSDVRGAAIELSNPVNKEMPLLRTSMMPALLDVVRRNRNVGEKDLRLFEMGKVFWKDEGGLSESWVLAGALTGHAGRLSWGETPRPVDFFDGKGVLWALAEALDIDTPEIACYDGQLLDAGASAGFSVRGEEPGVFGMLSKGVLTAWELADPVFVFEIDLERLCGFIPSAVSFEELARYPKARRDVALVVDERSAAGDVLAAVETLKEPLLVDTQVFDIYAGKQLAAGKKSLGFGLTYMSRERTLTDEEVDEAHSRIVDHLMRKFGAVLR